MIVTGVPDAGDEANGDDPATCSSIPRALLTMKCRMITFPHRFIAAPMVRIIATHADS